MVDIATVLQVRNDGRYLEQAVSGDEELGPLKLLPGLWSNLPGLPGRGWNMIALPVPRSENAPFRYRLLMNQFNEELRINTKDRGVPNRGVTPDPVTGIADQFIVAMDYEQSIAHIATDDNPPHPKLRQAPGTTIHHEPGLFLHMLNKINDQFDVARLGSIPHGDSLLALGTSDIVEGGGVIIPPLDGLPIGLPPGATPATSPYLAPYAHYINAPFLNLFEPLDPLNLLRQALAGMNVTRTTVLSFDTTVQTGGILNIPFVVAEANPTEMQATFWIHELAELDGKGKPKLVMQYSQVVMLEFFDRLDGVPGRIKWPHISINTMERVAEDAASVASVVEAGGIGTRAAAAR